MQSKTACASAGGAARCPAALLILAGALAIWPSGSWGQEVAPDSGRLHIGNVAVSGIYLSNGASLGNASSIIGTNLESDVSIGGSIELGWLKTGERTNVSFLYTPSYTGRLRYTSVNSLNHYLSFAAVHNVTPRWTLRLSVNADISTFEQFLFAPTAYSNAAAVSATFGDLTNGLLSQRFTNPQLAAALTAGSAAQSPIRTLLYGDRMASTRAEAAISYSYTPRLSLSFTGGGDHIQHLSGDPNGPTASASLALNTTSGGGSAALSYDLSPSTRVGGTVGTRVISSVLYRSIDTTSSFSVGRAIAGKWVVQGHAGVGVSRTLRQTLAQQGTGPQPVGGVSLAYKGLAHTLLGSFERNVGDVYGLGASATSTFTASWRWQRSGQPWWLDASESWERLYSTSGWRTLAGVGRRAGKHAALLAEYVYLRYSSRYGSSADQSSQSAVRLSVVWNPRQLPH